MNQSQTVDQGKAAKFYRVLREHLSQSNAGKQAITAFESNPEKQGAALAEYLREQLPQDEALANQIAGALGEDNEFATIVIGGQVDQIINIARLGVLNLNLTQKKYFYIFRDVKQVIVFLSAVLLVGGAIAYGVWKSNQPRWMDGEFNIAVAEFNQPSAPANSIIAPVASQVIFEFLDREYQPGGFGGDVQVIHDKIGVIPGANEAEDLAKKVNAHLVIYGDVSVIDGHALISPRFYVANNYRANVSELTGQHKVSLPVEFNTNDLIQYESGVNRELRQRGALLIEFTKGLAYLALDNLEPALESIENALDVANKYGDFEGKEVLYLFAAIASRRMGDFEAARSYIDQVLDLNSSYGRAYIALGNIYYDQKDFDKALGYYEQAGQLDRQSPGAFLAEKASVGAGNVYTYQYQTADKSEKAALAAILFK